MYDFVGIHAFDLSAFRRDLTVVRTGDYGGIDPVDAAVAGQDSAFKGDWTKGGDKAVRPGAEL